MNDARPIPVHGAVARILVVEDDAELALMLAYNLEAEGYFVDSVGRGEYVAPKLIQSPPDLLILDWMLPGVSGLELCGQLRAREATRSLPIIMVTGRGEESERVLGLSAGADDYVVKPFSVSELMARVRALLRRSRSERSAEQFLALELDLDGETRSVRRGSRKVRLAPTEFRLLESLLERPGRVFSRAKLRDRVWGREVEVDDRTIDVYIGRLRKALSRYLECDAVHTLRGSGHFFDQSFRIS